MGKLCASEPASHEFAAREILGDYGKVGKIYVYRASLRKDFLGQGFRRFERVFGMPLAKLRVGEGFGPAAGDRAYSLHEHAHRLH
jgi:hypothetical protein